MSGKPNKESFREDFIKLLEEVKDGYYNPDEVNSLRSFIEGYKTESDFAKLNFSWNGGKGSDFIDLNQEFRDKVSVYICVNKDIEVPHLLLRDIVKEIGKASRESWGAPEYIFLLSERLLKETKGKYVEIFGEMLFSNMDTYGACISMDFSDIDVKEIIRELKEKEEKSKLILDLIEYFETKI